MYNKYKTLQVVYNNYKVIYDELLALDNKTHQKHLQFLAIEIYKIKQNPSLKINLTQVSCGKHISRKLSHIPYSQRKDTSLSVADVNTQKYGINLSNFRWNV